MSPKQQTEEQDLSAGESTGDEPKVRTPRKKKEGTSMKAKKTTKTSAKKTSKKKHGKKPGPKEGYRLKDKEKYPNTKYLFDEVYHRNRKTTFATMKKEMAKYFPDHSGLTQASFDRKV